MDAVVPKEEDEVVVGKEEEEEVVVPKEEEGEVVGKSTISRKCRSGSRDVLRATTGSCPAPSAIDKWLTAPAWWVQQQQPAPPCSNPTRAQNHPRASQQCCKGCRRRRAPQISIENTV